MVLQEGSPVIATRQAVEAFRIIEVGGDRGGHRVFIADKFTFNREAAEALRLLHIRSAVRQCTRINGLTAMAGGSNRADSGGCDQRVAL